MLEKLWERWKRVARTIGRFQTKVLLTLSYFLVAGSIFYDLINEFYKLTGVPVIINTSFNVRGEPIVCAPQHAFQCFMRTGMDYLVMDRFLLDKRDMKPLEGDIDWQREFELD